MYASKNTHPSMTTLIEVGADAEILNNEGKSALSLSGGIRNSLALMRYTETDMNIKSKNGNNLTKEPDKSPTSVMWWDTAGFFGFCFYLFSALI